VVEGEGAAAAVLNTAEMAEAALLATSLGESELDSEVEIAG